MIIVGVDGCHAGWIAGADVDGDISINLPPTFDDLLKSWKAADRILVDIPIGLPSWANPARECDRLARRRLGSRASSVFSPPCREAAAAASIEDARQKNLWEVQRSLSAQAWGICRKIIEVDRALLIDPDARRKVFEVHPEVCFWSLGGRVALKHAKTTAAGKQERLDLLLRWEPRSAEILQSAMSRHKRRDVQADDVLDALVALVTARAEGPYFRSLPEHPGIDDKGLPMRMVYRDLAPTVA